MILKLTGEEEDQLEQWLDWLLPRIALVAAVVAALVAAVVSSRE